MPCHGFCGFLSGLLLALAVALPAAAQADAKAEAKRHFEAGLSFVKVEDFAAAVTEFEASVGLYATKTALFNLANCYQALHRYGEALTTLERLERDFSGSLGDLAGEIESIKRSIDNMVARLEVRVAQPGATVRVDGREAGQAPLSAPLIVGPGEHQVTVELSGHRTENLSVRLVSQGREVLSVRLAPETADPPPAAAAPPNAATTPPPPAAEAGPSTTRVALRWTALALAAAAAVASGVSYGLAAASASDFDAAASDYDDVEAELAAGGPSAELTAREAEAWSALNEARDDTALFSNLGLGFGIGAGVFAVTTVALWLTEGDGEQAPDPSTPTVVATPTGVGLAF